MRKLFVVFLFLPFAAIAQNNRSAVSINGNDTNPCTPASPCRSFGAALSQTNAGGEIIAVDSAGYGPFVIDRWVTVMGAPGVHAAITVTTGYGISATPSSPVTLRNLVLIGNGGIIGVGSGPLTLLRVLNCVVRGFTSAGIDAGGPTVIDHTAILDNTTGIRFANASAGPVAHSVVTNSSFQGNNSGVIVRESAIAVLKDSVISGNSVGALALSVTDNQTAEITIENCTIAHNTSVGVQTSVSGNGASARAFLSQNVIAYNTQGAVSVTGAIFSFNNNRFVGNSADGGPFGSATFQ